MTTCDPPCQDWPLCGHAGTFRVVWPITDAQPPEDLIAQARADLPDVARRSRVDLTAAGHVRFRIARGTEVGVRNVPYAVVAEIDGAVSRDHRAAARRALAAAQLPPRTR